ncbi:MAG: MFS transporter [Proteobacteria bacterium]|nr:MFS transporter [Pseudomonadota bacterium]
MLQNRFSFWFPFSVVFFEIATYLANDMYLPGLPQLMQAFKISQESAQDTILYFFLGSASMQLLIGPLSDRFGRNIILVMGAILYTASSFLCVYTNDIVIFFILRFIQGSTVCAVVVAGYSAIHEAFEAKIAIKIVSIMGSVTILAPAFGPVLGALVIKLSDWQMIFILLGICGLLSIALLGIFVPQTQKERHTLNIKSILKDYAKITTNRNFVFYTLCFCFLFLALICWVVESPFLIMDGYHKTTMEYGLIQFYVFGFFAIGAQITAFLVNRTSSNLLIKIGLGVALLGAIIFVMLSQLSMPFYCNIAAMMVLALGSAMAFGPLSRAAIESSLEPMGRRMAMFSSYMSLFGVFATVLVRVLHSDSMRNLALVMVFAIFTAFVCLMIVKVVVKHNP